MPTKGLQMLLFFILFLLIYVCNGGNAISALIWAVLGPAIFFVLVVIGAS